VTLKREYFPYFVQGRDITINQVELYAIQDDGLISARPDGVDPDALKDGNEFEILLSSDDTVLGRENGAHVFLLLRYSIS
jgi:hypothetical protein